MFYTVKLGPGGRILSRESHGSKHLNHEGGCRMDGIFRPIEVNVFLLFGSDLF